MVTISQLQQSFGDIGYTLSKQGAYLLHYQSTHCPCCDGDIEDEQVCPACGYDLVWHCMRGED